jgi:hypothetical protein
MSAGADVIYQAALIVPPWLRHADFLERVEEASNLGAWGYEAVDTNYYQLCNTFRIRG